jgi:hypothetical protein
MDRGEGVPRLHEGAVFDPGLHKSRLPDDFPYMIRIQRFACKIKKHVLAEAWER